MKTKLFKWIKRRFKAKKWTLIGNYNYAYKGFLLYARMKPNGIIEWKTTSITGTKDTTVLSHDCLDLHKRFFALVDKAHKLPEK